MVEAVLSLSDKNGLQVELSEQTYNCNGYTHFASRENPTNPNNSNNKVIMASEYEFTYTNEMTGITKIKTLYNSKDLLKDDYVELDKNTTDAQAIDDAKDSKVIATFLDGNLKVAHSAVVTSNTEGDGENVKMFLSKNQYEIFSNKPYTKSSISNWKDAKTGKEEKCSFGGYYIYKGDKTMNKIKTDSNGKSNATKEFIIKKIVSSNNSPKE